MKTFNYFTNLFRGAALILAVGLPLALQAKPVVVVDAAHGGSDKGIQGGGKLEKDWTLKFAKALQKALEQKGFSVLMARTGDDTLSQEKREQTSNISWASAVLVLHAEREWSGGKQGPLLVVEPPSRGSGEESSDLRKWGAISAFQYRENLKLARALGEKLGIGPSLSSLSDSRGLAGEAASLEGLILCGPHQSLRNLIRPAVVLVPLFLSSASDVGKFSKDEAVQDFAEKVAQGVQDFLK